jgi:hypothetical protein
MEPTRPRRAGAWEFLMRALASIAEDDPITLAEASEAVLRGAVSEQTLRAEARRGNLQVERLGKNLFTTPNYIKAWRNQCRVQQNRPDSTSAKTRAASVSGSSGIGIATDEQDALKKIALSLKNGSLNTSRKSTRHDQGAGAEVMPFRSPR